MTKNDEVAVTPAVRAVANRLGVDLTTVTGTGVGGRISMNDVWAAERPRPAAEEQPRQSTPRVTGALGRYIAHFRAEGGAMVAVDAAARNPLLDQYKQSNPETVRAASAVAPPPTLFSSGDLPAFTGSGIDPHQLLMLPWQVRHAAARTADRPGLQKLFEQYTPINEETASAASVSFGGHQGNVDYEQRFRQWLMDGATGSAEV